MSAGAQSGALASVCVCVYVCLRTILLPHYQTVSSSAALMRSLTVTMVIKVKPRPKHRNIHTHTRTHKQAPTHFAGPQFVCAPLQKVTHLLRVASLCMDLNAKKKLARTFQGANGWSFFPPDPTHDPNNFRGIMWVWCLCPSCLLLPLLYCLWDGDRKNMKERMHGWRQVEPGRKEKGNRQRGIRMRHKRRGGRVMQGVIYRGTRLGEGGEKKEREE